MSAVETYPGKEFLNSVQVTNRFGINRIPTKRNYTKSYTRRKTKDNKISRSTCFSVASATVRFNVTLLVCSCCGLICCILLLYGLCKIYFIYNLTYQTSIMVLDCGIVPQTKEIVIEIRMCFLGGQRLKQISIANGSSIGQWSDNISSSPTGLSNNRWIILPAKISENYRTEFSKKKQTLNLFKGLKIGSNYFLSPPDRKHSVYVYLARTPTLTAKCKEALNLAQRTFIKPASDPYLGKCVEQNREEADYLTNVLSKGRFNLHEGSELV
ncbi:hypothetical protein E2986_10811 [Frieseomelitta varia]|uniref:Uncharacterized protein n=1 Tax=Frieseomelitta varia TaxID=561572 RepID=A0A833RZC7_9HYME|nr:hypothetical protein E2986_10811 [Frieseomelitta varia]